MTAKRHTGKDYRKQLLDLESKQKSLKKAVNIRLLELVTANPNVKLPTSRAGGLK